MTTPMLAFLGVVVIAILFVVWRIFRCLHDWEPVVERELPSKAEILKANGEDLSTWRSTNQLASIAQKTFFAIISCKKCGAVKQFEVRT
jgi:hypothetical protein